MNDARARNLSALALAALLPACFTGAAVATADGDGPDSDVDVSSGAGDSDDEATTGDEPGTGGEGGEPGCIGAACEPPSCDGAVQVGRSPLRRLTRNEYVHSVRDLFGLPTLAVELGATDSRSGSGFTANDLAVDALSVEAYLDSAEALADVIVEQHLAGVTDCPIEDEGCIEGLLDELARDAYRRPLSADESAALHELHSSARAAWGPAAGLQAAIQGLLSSPGFLYHTEVGEPDPDDPAVVRLTGHELAARLSYFMWQSLPDAELRAVADDGILHDPVVLAAQARRMLADEKLGRAIGRFHEEWLELDVRLGDAYKDPTLFPEWDEALEASMFSGARKFAREVILAGDGRISTLFAAPFTLADASLGALYGLDVADGDGFQRVDTDPNERRGILAQAAFLAGHAHASEPSWVQRGLFVRTRALCQTIPAPPPDVDMSNLNNPARTSNPSCKGCHVLMDPIGQGMDNYDALGHFVPVDGATGLAPGRVEGAAEADYVGEFAGLSELSLRLSQSRSVQDCMARQWFRYATRRLEQKADACTLTGLLERFDAAHGDVRELMVEIALSDGFRLLHTPQI